MAQHDGVVTAGDPPHAGATVVQWGDDAGGRRGAPRIGGVLRMLRHDRRVLLATAGLSAASVLASLIGTWQVTVVTQEGLPDADQVDELTVRVATAGLWGAAYVFGVLFAIGALALALFGPRPGLAYVRVAGLGWCGALLGVLAVGWSDLARRTYALPGVADPEGIPGVSLDISVGRGMSMAVVAAVLLGLTFYLSGARVATRPGAEPPEPAGSGWRWRPPRAAVTQGPRERATGPLDLTVAPAEPFAPQPDERA